VALQPDAIPAGAGRGGSQPEGWGRHVVSLAAADAQLDLVAAAFRAALSRDWRCLLIADRTASEVAVRALEGRGCEAGRALESGQLQLLTADETYTRGGYFDADRMLELVEDAACGAEDAGYRGWCGVGEVTWFGRGVPGAGRLLEYEYRLNEVEALAGTEVICLYDVATMPRWLSRELKKVHPLVHAKRRVTPNRSFAAGPTEAAEVPIVEELEPPIERLSCARLDELLSVCADGQLPADCAGRLVEHAAACRTCDDRLGFYRTLKRRLSSLRRPEEVRPGFWETVCERLADLSETPD